MKRLLLYARHDTCRMSHLPKTISWPWCRWSASRRGNQDQVDRHLKAALDLVDHQWENGQPAEGGPGRLKVKFPCLKVKDGLDMAPQGEAPGPDAPPQGEAPGPDAPPQGEAPGPDAPPPGEAPGPMLRLKVKDQGLCSA